jgi:hypothetical protein
MKIFNIVDALSSLRPGSTWQIRGDETFENLNWKDSVQTKPSKQEIEQEISRLQKEYDSTYYQTQRSQEYPPIADYLDAVVKGDQVQLQAYIDACLAVKQKYPKPE